MMQTVYQLPESLDEDLGAVQSEVEKFQRGEKSAAELRAFRVPRGVYEQREADTYMLRVRFPAGVVLPHQMRMLAKVARRYSRAPLHITTRQDVHSTVSCWVTHPALVELYGAGLTAKGGGGDTVRNITGCCDAGVCSREVFDPTPYVLAATEFLLSDPLSYQLPRKYKIAFSACPADCAGATLNDLGFIAKRREDVLGFAVYVGGGMGASARVADRLEDFIPAHEVHLVAEAVKRVFDQHGNRRNRNKARCGFSSEIGLARFRELYEAELKNLRIRRPVAAGPGGQPGFDRSRSGNRGAVARVPEWRRRYVVPQKQEGFHLVHIPLALGDIDADALESLAEIVEHHGEGILRATQRQNFVVRWVHQDDLPGLHGKLHALGLAGKDPPVLANLVPCTGAATCRLGICLARIGQGHP